MKLVNADKLKECFSDDTFKNRMVKVIIDRQPEATREELEEALEQLSREVAENE